FSALFIGLYCLLSSKRVLKAVFGQKFFVSLKRSVQDFFFGASTWLIAYPLVGAISQVLSLFMLFFYQGPQIDQVAVKHLKDAMEFPWLLWTSVVLIATLVPFLEEVLFRGFLQSWLRRVLGAGG